MGFLSQFATNFTSQERETELYALWSSIGVNMEKSILEEQNKINAEFTDINNFSEDTLRSWLAFFLQKIPYRTTATTQVTVSMSGSYGQTTIPQYDELITDDGVTYTQLEEVTLTSGDTRTVTAAQGHRITETGTYNTLIKVQANNPDLSYLTVKIDGTEIPEVTYETSYDQLSFIGSWKPETEEGHEWGGTPFLQNAYGTKGNFYTVIADGTCKFADDAIPIEFKTGDMVIFDGTQWQLQSSNTKLKPIQFTNTYAVPTNGYFAYYYDSYLYIKIFSGTEIDDPSGKDYEVSYIQSDGVQGQIKANTLSYVSSYEDTNETTVELEVSNTASTTAVNEPSTGKLGLYLKQRLYGSINVSSVPEYTAWLKAQPEVGDCLVLSDYERYVRNGKTSLEATGIVDIYLVDPNGDSLATETIDTLLDRLEPYKDIAVVKVSEFTPVYNHLVFQYTTTTNEDQFEQYLKSKASQYYNLSYLQSTNSSLFDSLDIAAVIKDIQENSSYESTGLILKGYHYKEVTVKSQAKEITIESYDGEQPGKGWYVLELDDGTEVKFNEVPSAGSTESCFIYSEDDPTNSKGSHVSTMVSMDLTSYTFETATFKCYWAMANEGILSIGADNGLRKLKSVEINKVD